MQRARDRIIDSYVERHHVIPKCLGTDGEVVKLTPEEHYVAHLLLVKMYPGQRKLVYAAHMMTKGQRRSNKMYGWLRRKWREAVSADHIGIPLSAEHRKKLSEAHRGKKRRPLTESVKAKIRAANAGQKPSALAIAKTIAAGRARGFYGARKGSKHTIEAKEKNRLAHLGKIVSVATRNKIRATCAHKRFLAQTQVAL